MRRRIVIVVILLAVVIVAVGLHFFYRGVNLGYRVFGLSSPDVIQITYTSSQAQLAITDRKQIDDVITWIYSSRPIGIAASPECRDELRVELSNDQIVVFELSAKVRDRTHVGEGVVPAPDAYLEFEGNVWRFAPFPLWAEESAATD